MSGRNFKHEPPPEGTTEPLAELLSRAAGVGAPDRDPLPSGAAVARFCGFDGAGRPLVQVPGRADGETEPALTTIKLLAGDAGRDALVLRLHGEDGAPVIAGLLEPHPSREDLDPATELSDEGGIDAQVDGRTVVLTGRNEVVLRCGKASITLTRAGKVLIQGTYVSSGATGVHRIKGGSVQIN